MQKRLKNTKNAGNESVLGRAAVVVGSRCAQVVWIRTPGGAVQREKRNRRKRRSWDCLLFPFACRIEWNAKPSEFSCYDICKQCVPKIIVIHLRHTLHLGHLQLLWSSSVLHNSHIYICQSNFERPMGQFSEPEKFFASGFIRTWKVLLYVVMWCEIPNTHFLVNEVHRRVRVRVQWCQRTAVRKMSLLTCTW